MADPKFRVLVVDDLSTLRTIIKNLFHQLGYPNVKEAQDGLEALIKLRTEQFDFAIIDKDMPVMDGFTLIQEMRADKALASVPVLMVFTEATKENISLCTQVGANGYIVKPFTAEELNEKITKILERIKKGY